VHLLCLRRAGGGQHCVCGGVAAAAAGEAAPAGVCGRELDSLDEALAHHIPCPGRADASGGAAPRDVFATLASERRDYAKLAAAKELLERATCTFQPDPRAQQQIGAVTARRTSLRAASGGHGHAARQGPAQPRTAAGPPGPSAVPSIHCEPARPRSGAPPTRAASRRRPPRPPSAWCAPRTCGTASWPRSRPAPPPGAGAGPGLRGSTRLRGGGGSSRQCWGAARWRAGQQHGTRDLRPALRGCDDGGGRARRAPPQPPRRARQGVLTFQPDLSTPRSPAPPPAAAATAESPRVPVHTRLHAEAADTSRFRETMQVGGGAGGAVCVGLTFALPPPATRSAPLPRAAERCGRGGANPGFHRCGRQASGQAWGAEERRTELDPPPPRPWQWPTSLTSGSGPRCWRRRRAWRRTSPPPQSCATCRPAPPPSSTPSCGRARPAAARRRGDAAGVPPLARPGQCAPAAADAHGRGPGARASRRRRRATLRRAAASSSRSRGGGKRTQRPSLLLLLLLQLRLRLVRRGVRGDRQSQSPPPRPLDRSRSVLFCKLM